jgi:hypothetical protein
MYRYENYLLPKGKKKLNPCYLHSMAHEKKSCFSVNGNKNFICNKRITHFILIWKLILFVLKNVSPLASHVPVGLLLSRDQSCGVGTQKFWLRFLDF